jgi:hypothetical protein
MIKSYSEHALFGIQVHASLLLGPAHIVHIYVYFGIR